MKTIVTIDPRRITEGGPRFAQFWILVSSNRMKCKKNGDVFDRRGLYDAYMERRNLAPIIKGAANALHSSPNQDRDGYLCSRQVDADE